MKLQDNSEIREILDQLEHGLIDYMPDASYKKSDVNRCMSIINDYLQRIGNAKSSTEGMKIVENTVVALNHLNEETEYELIETDQREDICEIIILAGNIKGFNDRDEDITEEWRDW